MTARLPQALFWSGSLHATAAVLLLLFSLSAPCAPELAEPHFQVVPLSGLRSTVASSPGSSVPTAPSVKFIAPPRPVITPSVVPDEVPAPVEAPHAPRNPTSATPRSTTKPAALPPHSAPHASAAPVSAPPRQHIDIASITDGLRAPASPTASVADTTKAMQSYFGLLKARTLAAFVKPSAVSDGLVTGVTFQISAAGVISHVRVTRSSGDRDFDTAVLAAFARVRMPAKPDQRAEELELSFRTMDLIAP